MKKLGILLCALSLLFACEKNDKPKVDQDEVDELLIQEYVTKQDSSFIRHSSGIYYLITKEGDGGRPGSNYYVDVAYKGSLLDSTIFDQSTKTSFSLGNVIRGWQIAIPLLTEGGSGTFIIPSSLGYGSKSVGSIPANSVLVFDVTLIGVHRPK